ncbi:carbamate kinase [uncultured Vagococcus sp.]|uniref:carbamate kinase n=1 Tax=uncultured Vagococcus sp. TaxID=189676 RepID=UPI0028D500F0|nr:carbamate kinase [uncultured Vagococcus sp.]
MAKLVIALGGNALGQTVSDQKKAIHTIVPDIVSLTADHQVVITHGNGPQVGMINHAFQQLDNQQQTMPFAECTAMSQGYIGYHLQQALGNELKKQGLETEACTCLTQVVVAKEDPAFRAPTKPIGLFYSEREARHLVNEQGYVMKEDAGRGYRRVVPSPFPLDIVEKTSIQDLLEKGQLVIACGGGGIPVIQEGQQLVGVDAVIDKDFSSELLAEVIEADLLLILTAVDGVFLNYGKTNQQPLANVSTKELSHWMTEGHFPPGSMLPKVLAAIRFAEVKPTNKAIITSIAGLREPLFQRGTVIQEGV